MAFRRILRTKNANNTPIVGDMPKLAKKPPTICSRVDSDCETSVPGISLLVKARLNSGINMDKPTVTFMDAQLGKILDDGTDLLAAAQNEVTAQDVKTSDQQLIEVIAPLMEMPPEFNPWVLRRTITCNPFKPR